MQEQKNQRKICQKDVFHILSDVLKYQGKVIACELNKDFESILDENAENHNTCSDFNAQRLSELKQGKRWYNFNINEAVGKLYDTFFSKHINNEKKLSSIINYVNGENEDNAVLIFDGCEGWDDDTFESYVNRMLKASLSNKGELNEKTSAKRTEPALCNDNILCRIIF